jgi:hypothetical protein
LIVNYYMNTLVYDIWNNQLQRMQTPSLRS